ncbi:nucleosome assembly protein family [Acanthamoeba castellanii str. Neff]|uniref:Nucleosome assembly protein family n=1 Tax=Acanthamoeba castellanii (strain ATCC 30010 / Neff) TaxID=1257118 RepID=L8HAZ3_ACACF|nr:nucleosome assembly protein family [Acanthamoeba castellanii str. Neff]ELR22669.1 nucleosome assembly protein family [Acanthamoeba castellanii str. Neff]
MGDKQQPTFDFSKLNFDLSGGGAGGFNLQGALQGLQSQLGALGMIGADSGYFQTLPKAVQRRVRALRNLDREYEKIEEEFEKELKALELKYHKEQFTPLYQKRAAIINGKVEPTDEEAKEESDDEEEDAEPKIQEIKEEKKDEEVKEETEEEKNVVGVPEFWLTALKHHEMLDSAISEKDEEALKYLTDITQDPVEEEAGSFTLKFHFRENPFFTNEVISKTYHLDGDGEEGDEVVCESVDSTQINWKEGQDLTQGVKKSFGPGGSFFNFFAPPEVKQGKQPSPQIVSMMELDFEMAVSLKEEIIKHAVHWFTGDASVDGFGGDDGEEDDEDGEFGGEGDEDDDDDEEDGEFAPPEGGEGKPECKQQ